MNEDFDIDRELQELVSGSPEIGGDLGLKCADIDAGFARLQLEVAGDPKLRSLSTTTRIAIIGGTAVASLLFAAAAMGRLDLGDLLTSADILFTLSLVAAGLVALLLSVRPMHRPPLDPRVMLGVAGLLAVGVPLFHALVPHTTGSHVSMGGASHAFGCLARGFAVALPTLIVARVLDRGGHGGTSSAGFAAIAAGATGLAALDLSCSLVSVEHIVLGHAPLIVALLLAYLGLSRLGRPLSARRAT